MSLIRITAGDFSFVARFEETAAPKTVAAFRGMLPYRESLIHVRWSGEACWIPMGDYDLGLGPENATSYPAPGHVILYPGGVSDGDFDCLWSLLLRQQSRAACGQPLPDHSGWA